MRLNSPPHEMIRTSSWSESWEVCDELAATRFGDSYGQLARPDSGCRSAANVHATYTTLIDS